MACEFILRFQETRGGKEHAVAVDHFSRFADKQGAVGIAVKSHSQSRFFCHHPFLEPFQVKRAAARVDVAAVG